MRVQAKAMAATSGSARRIESGGRGRADRVSSTASGPAWFMRAAILAGLGAAFHVFVFPPFSWTWLAWVAPLPVLLMLPAPSAAKAVIAVWLFGTLWALGVVAPWMTPALQALFGLSSLQTAGMLLLVCQCGLPFALLGWVLHAGRPATPSGACCSRRQRG